MCEPTNKEYEPVGKEMSKEVRREVCREVKTILKWVGGKKQVMPHLIKYLEGDFTHYFEPFVGGGSVLMKMIEINRLKPTKTLIYASDINPHLMNFYYCLQKDIENFMAHYLELQTSY